MLYDLFYKERQDKFENFTFSGSTWSAPSLEAPEKIRELLDSFHLVGRKIKKIKLIGLNYSLTRDCIEDFAYGCLSELPEDERQIRSDYNNISPDMLFPRNALVDEPLLIMFEDDEVLEINAPFEPIFRISMNRIPWGINAGTNQANVDANTLFSPCIGLSIADVEIHTYNTKKQPMYGCPFDEEPFEREFVRNIVLRFEDGTGLSFNGWIDYMTVQHIDQDLETNITWAQLKTSLYNWEDLHPDASNEDNTDQCQYFDQTFPHTTTEVAPWNIKTWKKHFCNACTNIHRILTQLKNCSRKE